MRVGAYRPDIDGLRAIAVIAVVIFHAWPGALPGGFVGVDVFFVISGYLIASQIFSEIGTGSFSIARFYERRARRILPALLATILASAAVAGLLLYPGELVQFAKSAIASALFSANIWFWLTSDYFAPAASSIPLLHLWSLGIEEQFYIAFPLLAWATPRRYLAPALAVLCAVSLGLSQYLAVTHPEAAFYLPFSRAFELLIGCILALSRKTPWPSLVNHTSVIGAAAMIAAMLGQSVPGSWPGVNALLPCIATVMITWSGPSAIVSRLLALRPIVYVGKISYSLYLAHWPVLVFGKRLFPNHAGTATFALAVLSLTVLMAVISYHLIEQPFRRRRGNRRPAMALGISAASILAVVTAGAAVIHAGGFPGDAGQRVAQVLAFQRFDPTATFRTRACFLEADQRLRDFDTEQCVPDKTTAIVWGDSHAASLYPGLRDELAARGVTLGQLTAAACGPIVGIDVANRPLCRALNDEALAWLIARKPRLVIMAAAWRFDPDALDHLGKTTAALATAGIKVVVLGTLPLFKVSVPALLAQRIHNAETDRTASGELELGYLRASDAALARYFEHRKDARFISTFATICQQERCPLDTSDEAPMQFDSVHLTGPGSRYFAERLAPPVAAAAASLVNSAGK